MTVIIFIASLFLGIMIPTLLVSATPELAKSILETIRIYKKGSLTIVTGDYITGAGYHRRGKMYMYREENGSERFESGRVFGWLLIIFISLFLIISLIIILSGINLY